MVYKPYLNCHLCDRSCNRLTVAESRGAASTEIAIITDYPSVFDDEAGLILVSDEAKMLKCMFDSINIDYGECFLTSVVKCYDPDRVVPTKKQQKTCYKWLYREITNLEPKLIILLGELPLQLLLGSKYKFEEWRQKVLYWKPELSEMIGSRKKLSEEERYGDVLAYEAVVIEHPRKLIKYPSKETGGVKWKAWQDMIFLKRFLEKYHE